MIEVNVSGEESRYGVAPREAAGLAERVGRMPNIDVAGLMTVAPRVNDPEGVRAVFRTLRELRDAIGLRELSMGMTDDFEVASKKGRRWCASAAPYSGRGARDGRAARKLT